MDIIKTLYLIFACHFIGDYVLQTDFLAKTKGQNWWHLIAHCVLYTVPFAIVFGIDWELAVILGSHLIIDPLKARWNVINYAEDQCLHLLIAGGMYLI